MSKLDRFDMSGTPENNKPTDAKGRVLKFRLDQSAFERQPTESPEAFEAWALYKDLKYTGEGGIEKVAKELGKSQQLIQRWSIRWQWKERFRLYQSHKQIEQEAIRRKEMQAHAKRWVARTGEIKDKGYEVGKKLIERGEALLALPTYKREIREVVKVGDQEIPTITYLVFNEHPKDGRQYIETGIKLQRLSAEMPTENLGLGFAPEDLDRDLDNMSAEDLISYAQELERLRQLERQAESGS